MRRIDPTERAHLRDASGYTPPIHRFALSRGPRGASSGGTGCPSGPCRRRRSVQRVLQYPVCLLVVSHEVRPARRTVSRLSTPELCPAPAGPSARCSSRRPATPSRRAGHRLTDGSDPLADEAPAHRGPRGDRKRPADPERQRAAVAADRGGAGGAPPVDEEGRSSTPSSSTSRATRRSSGSPRCATSSTSPNAPPAAHRAADRALAEVARPAPTAPRGRRATPRGAPPSRPGADRRRPRLRRSGPLHAGLPERHGPDAAGVRRRNRADHHLLIDTTRRRTAPVGRRRQRRAHGPPRKTHRPAGRRGDRRHAGARRLRRHAEAIARPGPGAGLAHPRRPLRGGDHRLRRALGPRVGAGRMSVRL